MTFVDWMKDTHSQLKRDPLPVAAKGSVLAFWYGALRRVAPQPDADPIWRTGDWDICCILDACRMDLFNAAVRQNEVGWLPATADSITSVGSMSAEWINNTFSPRWGVDARRTAYITGNPFSGKDLGQWPNLPLDEGSQVAYLDEAWRTEWQDYYGAGDISTVPPGPLTDRAIDVWRRREELDIDRVVIHYMQPHAPFRSRPEWFGPERDLNEFGQPMPGGRTKSIWHKWRDGQVDGHEVWDAYRDNLLWVLEDIDRLRTNANARIALSSDHGNGAGEWGIWGHPGGIPTAELRRVPWVEIEATDERTVEPDVQASDADLTDEEVEERLAALGYA